MSIEDGGPAFPAKVRHTQQDGIDGVIQAWVEQVPGMTLRDYFAGQMIPGLVAVAAHDTVWHSEKIATDAFELADAMIAESTKEDAP